MHSPKVDLVINAILFQVCWFLAILSDWLWALVALVLLVFHAVMRFLNRKLALRLVLIAAVGIVVDSIWMNLSIVEFTSVAGVLSPLFIPLWLMILWCAFVLTLNSSMAWLLQKPMWFVVACSVMGPVSYAAGRRLGALNFDDAHLLLLSLQWGLLACLIVVLIGKQISSLSVPYNKSYGSSRC